ncbi:MAG: beta strand repeat-containing protein, partial [Candidatus Kapaibacterium sp.]
MKFRFLPIVILLMCGIVTESFGQARDHKVQRLVLDNNGSPESTIRFQTPVPNFTSYTLTWPIDDGVNNEVLVTDGSGVLSWKNINLLANNWLVGGNGNITNPNTEYIGTNTNVDFAMRANSVERLRLLASGGALIPAAGGLSQQLQFQTPNAAFVSSFQSVNQSANINYLLPPTLPTNNGYLTTTNSGTLTWNNIPTGESVLTGNGVATRVAFWNGTVGSPSTSLTSSANLFWDNVNSRLGINVPTPSQTLTIDGNLYLSGTGNQLHFKGTGTGVTTFQAGAQGAANISYTLPVTIGGANNILVNDGAGALSWQPVTNLTNAWLLGGNTIANSATEYIGTKNAQDFVVRSTDIERLRLFAGGGLRLLSNAGTAQQLQFQNPAGTFTSTFRAGVQLANIDYVLPISQGGANSILLNDGSGNLSWTTSYEQPLTFNNGLTRTTNTVQLGGTLIQPTTIALAGNSFTLSGSGNVTISQFATAGIVKNSAAGVLSTGQVNLASSTEVTGILPIANGGTNSSTIGGAGTVAFSNGTSLNYTTVGTGGQVLVSNGTGTPTWQNPSGLVLANNGLSKAGDTVQLGGNMIKNSSIGMNNRSLTFNGAGNITVDGTVILAPNGTGVVQANRFVGSGSLTNAVDLATAEVNGILPIANGGTNSNTIGGAGTVAFSNGTSLNYTSVGTGGQVLVSNGTGTPTWQSPSGLVLANNGLTKSGDTVQIGGTFIKNTSVGMNSRTLTYNGAGNITVDGTVILAPNGTGVVQANRFVGSGSLTNAVDLTTAEVNGILPIANGGTNSSTIGGAGTVAFSNGTSLNYTAVGTAGQVLLSNGTGTPTWGSPTAAIIGANGITKSGDTIKLGGSLNQNTNIPFGTRSLTLSNSGDAGNVVIGKFTTAGIVKNSAAGVLSTGQVNLASSSEVTGTLGITNGGTGLTSAGANGTMLVSNGTIWTLLAPGSTNQVLTITGGGVPAWSAASVDWSILGNSGINPANNFLGTTTAADMRIRTNDIERINILSGGNVRLESNAGTAQQLQFENPAGTFSTNIIAGAQGADITYTLPTTEGAANTVLTNNGSGAMSWQSVAALANAWSLIGNSGTNPTNNFLGTTDAQDLRIRTSNIERLNILSGGNVRLESNAGTAQQLQLENPAGTFSTNFVAGAQGANITYTLPTTLPGTNGVLTSNSTGTQSWSTVDLSGGNQLLTGQGVATRVAFWGSTNTLTSSANLFWDNTNNRLGVGSPTPSQELDVNGDILIRSSNGQLQFTGNSTGITTINAGSQGATNINYTLPTAAPSGTVSALISNGSGQWSWLSANNPSGQDGFWSLRGNAGTSTANNFIGTTDNVDLRIRTNGIERIRVESTGNGYVGIGNIDAQQILHIHDGSNATYLKITNSNSGSGGNDGFDIGINTSSVGELRLRENQNMAFFTNNNQRMTILSGGNVGIGTGSPNELLEVNGGNSRFVGGSTLAQTYYMDLRNQNNEGLQLRFFEPDASGTNYTSMYADIQTNNYEWKLPSDAIPNANDFLKIASVDNLGGSRYRLNLAWDPTSGGGGGYVPNNAYRSGADVATRIAWWSDDSTLSSSSNLFWDNANNVLRVGTSSTTYTSLDLAAEIQGHLILTNGIGGPREMRWAERNFNPASAGTSHYISLSTRSDQDLSANVNYFWPSTAPNVNNMVLTTSTSGQWSWNDGNNLFWRVGGNSSTSNNFIGTTDNNAFPIRTNNSERARVYADGRLGIGPSTSLSLTNLPTYANDNSDHAFFYPTNDDLRMYITDDAADRFSIFGVASGFSTDLNTYQRAFSVRGDGRATISQRLGINVDPGTSSERLELRDGNFLISNSGTARQIRFQEPNAGGTNYSAFQAGAQSSDIT